ncbi:MAG: hypothetical protein ABL308_01475 [Oceanicaulis sp.]
MALADAPQPRAQSRLLRNIALAAGLGAFALSFPFIDAVLPAALIWLAGAEPGSVTPSTGGPALVRVAVSALLAANVGAIVFAWLGRGVIFRSIPVASPAPENPIGAAIAGGLAGLCAYSVARAALPAAFERAEFIASPDALGVFVGAPALVGFVWRIGELALEGAAARRRSRAGRRQSPSALTTPKPGRLT